MKTTWAPCRPRRSPPRQFQHTCTESPAGLCLQLPRKQLHPSLGHGDPTVARVLDLETPLIPAWLKSVAFPSLWPIQIFVIESVPFVTFRLIYWGLDLLTDALKHSYINFPSVPLSLVDFDECIMS